MACLLYTSGHALHDLFGDELRQMHHRLQGAVTVSYTHLEHLSSGLQRGKAAGQLPVVDHESGRSVCHDGWHERDGLFDRRAADPRRGACLLYTSGSYDIVTMYKQIVEIQVEPCGQIWFFEAVCGAYPAGERRNL